ncbi:hypothetical protein LI99_28435 [Mycolicibacterium smegmatis]|nr:hypothetical protein MSMEG_5749 [Mycolicibacterium smegmatis MC2 155]AIU17388.1 hypothetical protein LI99_28435 [Mycolicibacterium smegmatis]AIU10763.1 hypothetical protein LJ00_28430 [Mycolicibacterium smegmatis MC2 155]AIU24011.1 hypothetical protein LI98_28440 [Mycolicibacterium smegmatis]TBH48885.1 hypothetical protein EYS45_07785 [Mycolicibacterium smegmatis MC2 155]
MLGGVDRRSGGPRRDLGGVGDARATPAARRRRRRRVATRFSTRKDMSTFSHQLD